MVAKSLVVVVGCGEPLGMHRAAAHEKKQRPDGSRRRKAQAMAQEVEVRLD